MSLFTDLKEVFTAYAQRIKGLAAADEKIKADLIQAQRQVLFTINCAKTNQDNIAVVQTGLLLPGHTYRIYPHTKTWEIPDGTSGTTSIFWIQSGSVTPDSWVWFTPFLYIMRYPTVNLPDYIDITIPKDSNLVQIALRAKKTAGELSFRYEDIGVYGFSKYFGKISIIGDSIETFNKDGYKIDGYAMHYPAYDVVNVSQTWWHKLITVSDATLEVNASDAGSRVTNTHPYTSHPDFYDRVSLVGNPNVVFVTLGTNDSNANVSLGEYDFTTAYTDLSESTFRTAYIKGIKALQTTYPNVKIVCVAEKMQDAYFESIETIADTLGCSFVDCRDYDTSLDSSGIHPSLYGMNQILSNILYQEADLGALMEPQRLADGTDLNTATTPGTYTLHGSMTYINKPTEGAEHGILEVWHEDYNNLGRTFQRLTYTYKAGRTQTEIWTRSKSATSGATWTPWVSVVNADELNKKIGDTIGEPNLCKFTKDGTYVNNGVTFVANAIDNTITVSGTTIASIPAKLDLLAITPSETGVYYIKGCPDGGAVNKYFLGLWSRDTIDDKEIGNGLVVTLIGGKSYSVYVQVKDGFSVDNIVFAPVIVNVTNSNIVKFDDGVVTNEGITYTLDATDNTITANGSVSSTFNSKLNLLEFTPSETGIYYLSGCPKNGSKETYYFGVWSAADDVIAETGSVTGLSVTLTGGVTYHAYIQFKKGFGLVDNLVFRPVIVRGDIYSDFSLNTLKESVTGLETIIRKDYTKSGAVSIIELGGKNDGTVDIGSIVNQYTANFDIYLPCGKYLVTTPIVLVNSLFGENSIRDYVGSTPNKASSTLVSGLSTGTIITLSSTKRPVTIRNINIYCNSDENAISLGDTYRLCRLEDISISNLGNAIGILRNAPGSRNLYANNISIFAKQFKNSIGIKQQIGWDDRISNVEIMFCQIGLDLSGYMMASNVHVWTGANTHDDESLTHNWFVNTVGIITKDTFMGSNIYLDTCYNCIYSKNGNIFISNLSTWDDIGASYYEDHINVVKKEGNGNLKISSGVYRASRTDISNLADGEAENFIGLSI